MCRATRFARSSATTSRLTAGCHAELDFEIEVAASGVAGTPPAWGRLLIPCYFSETVTADTSVVYAPVSVQPTTPLTLYYYLDGLLHKLTDAYGTVSWDFTVKQIPKLKFHFMGVYNPVTDSPIPAGTDFSKFLVPKIASTQFTTWQMHAYSGPLQALSLDIANTLNWSQLIGYERAEVTDRKPTGKITMQLGPVADKDWWTSAKDALLGALTITHGVGAGNIVQARCAQGATDRPVVHGSGQQGHARCDAHSHAGRRQRRAHHHRKVTLLFNDAGRHVRPVFI